MPKRRPPPNAPAVEAIETTPNACVSVGCVPPVSEACVPVGWVPPVSEACVPVAWVPLVSAVFETRVAVGCSHSTLAGSGLVHAPVVCGVSLVGQVLENSTRLSSTVVEVLSDVRSQVCSMSTSMVAVRLPLSLEYTSELVNTVESPVWEHVREESWRLSAVTLQWQRSWIMFVTAWLIVLRCCQWKKQTNNLILCGCRGGDSLSNDHTAFQGPFVSAMTLKHKHRKYSKTFPCK